MLHVFLVWISPGTCVYPADRYWPSRAWPWSARGRRCLLLTLNDGQAVCIWSKDVDQIKELVCPTIFLCWICTLAHLAEHKVLCQLLCVCPFTHFIVQQPSTIFTLCRQNCRDLHNTLNINLVCMYSVLPSMSWVQVCSVEYQYVM